MTNSKNTMKYFEETEKVERDVYYHYTSVSSLYNIISSKTFWLTNLKSSNDKKELSYNLSQFKRDLNKAIEMEDDGETKRRLSIAQGNFEQIPKISTAKSEAYALSLCHKKDDLTHWDRYAGNCSGVAIAFNIAALKVYYFRKNLFVFANDLLPAKGIYYSEKDRQNDILNNLRAFLSIIDRRMEGTNNDDNWGERIFPRYIYSTYYNIRNFIKMDAFMDEDEVRLLFRPESIKSIESLIASVADCFSDEGYSIGLEYSQLIEELGLEERYFSLFKNGIRSYRKLCLSEIWGNGLIPEVVLGPMCTQDKKELRAFLDSCGLKGTKIVESKVPIR